MGKISQKELGKVKTCEELLLEFAKKDEKDGSSKIQFKEAEKDVYNISAPFEDGGQLYIAGRVEARDSEQSKVVFFKKEDDVWVPESGVKELELQDPFVARIDGMLVIGGVQIFADEEKPGEWNYRTLFYKGDSIRTLEPFANGPDKMKDIRLCQLEDKRILVMTRPQGKIGGRGKIGYTIINSLDELDVEHILSAEILENQFVQEEWGGCNEIHLLKNGLLGILSHIAKFDEEGNRHYYSTAFCFDAASGEYSEMKMIAVRNNFQDGPSKRDDLQDVIFSGGLIRNMDGTAQLYCGVSDAEGHTITIDDPFVSFENK